MKILQSKEVNMRGFILVLLFLLVQNIFGMDDKKYHTYYNFNNQKITVLPNKKIEREVHYNYIVLNEKGKNNLIINIHQGDDIKLDNAEITYLKNGKVLKSFKQKDLFKYVIDDNLASDSYSLIAQYQTGSYPIEVNVKYKTTASSYINIPGAFFIDSENEYCKKATVEVFLPKDIPFKYKSNNIKYNYTETELPKNKLYKFEANDINLSDYEAGQPLTDLPFILFHIPEFSFFGHAGNKSSYEDLSKFFWSLWNTEMELAPEHVQFLKDLTKNATTDIDKSKLVYKYLQDNFRYISIQLGIGGNKPISAQNTLKNKYGDCKGLSNYMVSALKALDIPSFPVIIMNSDNPIMKNSEDFVYDYANHIIVCIPNKEDTVWLECTNKRVEFGYIGYSNENKYVYPIVEKGGKLIATPKSNAENSQYHVNTLIEMVSPNQVVVNQNISGTGSIGLRFKSIFGGSKTSVASYFMNYMNWKQPTNYELNTIDENNFEMLMLIDNLNTASAGGTYFYEITPYTNWKIRNIELETRKKDFMTGAPFIDNDTLTFILPKGYKLNQVPANVKIDTEHLYFESIRTYDEEKRVFKIINTFKLLTDRVTADEYPEFKKTTHKIISEKLAKFSIKKEG